MSLDALPQVWQNIAVFLMDHWGQFEASVAMAQPLPDAQRELLARELELSGSYFFTRELTQEMADDLAGWLHRVVPSLWGEKEDLARMNMLFFCPSHLQIKSPQADFASLAKRFPFPLVFVLSPNVDLDEWITRHRFLFGNEVEYLTEDG